MTAQPHAGRHRFAGNPIRHKLAVDALPIVAWEWPGDGDPILLVHATGFHARCWDAVVEALPGRRVFALDLASHGASGRRAPPYDWRRFGEDVRESVAALGLQRTLGVGHSMGGHALVLAAAAAPQPFRGLLLVDPVIVDPQLTAAMRGLSADDHPVARRRDRWESPEAMFAAFRGRTPYCDWEPAVLRDYCEHGLERDPRGGFRLACPPAHEAAIYTSMEMAHILPAIAALHLPVDVIRARSRRPDDSPFDFGPSPTWERLAELLPDGRDEQLADCSHFIPMERPRWMAQRIAHAADGMRR